MKPTSYSLIAVSPQNFRMHRISFSRSAILIIVAAFFLSFSITVALLLAFPRVRVSDAARARLVAENQALTIENKNAAIGINQLNSRISHIEETEKNIHDMMQTAD
jgi:hypothetical protein